MESAWTHPVNQIMSGGGDVLCTLNLPVLQDSDVSAVIAELCSASGHASSVLI